MTLEVMQLLEDVCEARDACMERPLATVVDGIERDMARVEEDLSAMDVTGEAPAAQCVKHLLGLRGKRLRPRCVALAARTGPRGFGHAARELAIAAELVHAATLLHDDVVDVGDLRRGAPTARILYGNAASIFGGDWLLVEALRRIQAAGVPGCLDHALVVLRAMLEAESLQLAARGCIQADRSAYLRIARGKTASLFAWALRSGASAGGATEGTARALEAFGEHVGLAFQIVDDALDVGADPSTIGKTALADVREGKLTFPLVVAIERDPRIASWLTEACAEAEPSEAVLDAIARAVRATGALDEARGFAREESEEAARCLAAVPPSPARDALARTAADLTGRTR